MTKAVPDMYIPAMESTGGITSPSPAEEMLLRLQVQIVVSRRVALDRAWKYELNSPFWRIYVQNRAGASLTFAGKTIRLQPDCLYLIPAWAPFQTTSSARFSQDFIHFYLTGFPLSLQRRIFDRPLVLPPDPLLAGLRRRWQNGLLQQQGFAELGWTHALVHAVLASATARLTPSQQALCLSWLTETNDMRLPLECIDRRLNDPPSNGELARLCHLSTDHFIRRFRRAIGLTPARYSLERRMAVSAEWLTGGHRTVDDIAVSTGFADRFHFSRSFKAQFGQPPIAYRRMHRR